VEYDIKIRFLGRVFLPGFLKWVYPKNPPGFFWVRAQVSEPC